MYVLATAGQDCSHVILKLLARGHGVTRLGGLFGYLDVNLKHAKPLPVVEHPVYAYCKTAEQRSRRMGDTLAGWLPDLPMQSSTRILVNESQSRSSRVGKDTTRIEPSLDLNYEMSFGTSADRK